MHILSEMSAQALSRQKAPEAARKPDKFDTQASGHYLPTVTRSTVRPSARTFPRSKQAFGKFSTQCSEAFGKAFSTQHREVFGWTFPRSKQAFGKEFSVQRREVFGKDLSTQQTSLRKVFHVAQ